MTFATATSFGDTSEDQKARWQLTSAAAVSEAEVGRPFASLAERELRFPVTAGSQFPPGDSAIEIGVEDPHRLVARYAWAPSILVANMKSFHAGLRAINSAVPWRWPDSAAAPSRE